MENLKNILINLKNIGCCGIKISFEDEGAQYNEIITMNKLVSLIGLELSIKIGGCEAKRDVIDCIDLGCESIVGPMIESNFALEKYLKSIKKYGYDGKVGINIETIQGYNNINEMINNFKYLDFITVGRVDFIGSLYKEREEIDSNYILEITKNIFDKAKQNNVKCCLGGAISIKSKEFINELVNNELLDKFETRYVIFSIEKSDINKFEEMLYYANLFELEWMKYISLMYQKKADKDRDRIIMIEERLANNRLKNI